MINILNRYKTSVNPCIKALQLEVSTVCQLNCRYCPRTLSSNWENQIMSWEMYEKRIAPHFDHFEMVFLQGWGEPLLNPRFWDMVKLAKIANKKVGFVTNGILFDTNAAAQACDLGVDLISFTFTGSIANTHEYYRNGSSYFALQDTIRNLKRIKTAFKKNKPSIGISFTMMRGNIHEFPEAVLQASELGADQITASHTDCITQQDLESETVFLNPLPSDIDYIKDAAKLAYDKKMSFKAEPPKLTGEILACEPNPLRMTLFIRVDGTVVPCHQMALPPLSVQDLYFHGTSFEYRPIILGNVLQENLPQILHNQISTDVYNTFGCRIDGIALGATVPEAPAICKQCYKLYGV